MLMFNSLDFSNSQILSLQVKTHSLMLEGLVAMEQLAFFRNEIHIEPQEDRF